MTDLMAVSLFDGIAGFPRALSLVGVRTVATVEIDPAAAGVAADHFPDAAHFSDIKDVTADDLRATGFVPERGIVTAGWPCTDLSLAGLRLGLGGARSGLVGEVFRILGDLRPRWVVLENVPGLLSSVCPCPGGEICDSEVCSAGPHAVPGGACGRAISLGRVTGPGRCMAFHGGGMGTILRSLGQLGYGIAYRVLDAQYFGVPQRRRRVVIVGCLGNWAAPVEVLLEPARGGGDLASGRTPESSAATDAGRGAGDVGTVGTLMAKDGGWRIGPDEAAAGHIIANALTHNMVGDGGGADDNSAQAGHLIATTITAREGKGPDSDATTTLVPVDLAQITSAENRSNPQVGGHAPTLASTGRPAVAYALRRDPGGTGQGHNTTYMTHALTAEGADASEDGTGRGTPLVFDWQTSGSDRTRPNISSARTSTLGTSNRDALMRDQAVRRLTPTECERLQGYPDGWTATSNGVPQSDSARYRQLGNSIAVPVFAWVGGNLVAVDETMRNTENREGEK